MDRKNRNAKAILGMLAQADDTVGEAFRVRTFGAGETICTPAEMSSYLYLLVSGRAQLSRVTGDGRRFAVATLGPGSLFGEASMLGSEGPGTYAVALEPCTVWVMAGKEARKLSADSPMFGFGLMQGIGQRVVEAETQLERMAYGTISARLAGLLLNLGGARNQAVVSVTHQELADMLGTYRETVSKTLQEFRRRGLVSPGRRRLTLLDVDALRAEAGLFG
jgi:CRP-like cAMP-binding protein